MNRIFVIIVAAIVVVVVGALVWQIVLPSVISPAVGTSTPAPQKFDTTGGQDMRPRWETKKELGDGAAN